ncbi:MAG: hypothetical protein ACQEWU_14310 [Bacillota bacterium]|uniref:hypothetical protein n=1 Tax=unclassified Virgibacillus TaxID=2620237 RepID=UPI000EF4FDB7|nr:MULTISPECIES: hypothetical protein [unclassified Virgibacillus]MCC2251830.1 hypothetical protein [Virgibacillus sp. AGTR]MDY7044832.1 hypothetical protein [Virgibacillus sp. M23]QRZ16310.1 hypothetical protein JUJ52_10735 [Virgibacillus sp. AGTR]
MKKTNSKRTWGWFGWTFFIVLFVSFIGSTVFFFALFDIDLKAVFQDERASGSTEIVDAKNNEKKEQTKKIAEQENESVSQNKADIGDFIAQAHDFYNDTTGYGAINDIDWDEQVTQAQTIRETINNQLGEIANESLIRDLDAIKKLTNQLEQEKNMNTVRQLHRYFHDLDIVWNNYSRSKKLWGVTETEE